MHARAWCANAAGMPWRWDTFPTTRSCLGDCVTGRASDSAPFRLASLVCCALSLRPHHILTAHRRISSLHGLRVARARSSPQLLLLLALPRVSHTRPLVASPPTPPLPAALYQPRRSLRPFELSFGTRRISRLPIHPRSFDCTYGHDAPLHSRRRASSVDLHSPQSTCP